MPDGRKKAVVGMSGGVDSSVAALLLKEQGYDVTGVTILTSDEMTGQPAEDAAMAAGELGIDHATIDCRDIFEKKVTGNFISEYRCGRTPNPCVVCNRYIKWEALCKKADELDAGYVATGHYARVVRLENGRYALRRAVYDRKDQTYALYRLSQEQLSRTIFPLGGYEKSEIRKIAAKEGLVTADKHESQDICFVPDGDYAGFISAHTGRKPTAGNFVDKNGNILGRHRGIESYTVGQRKGLGLYAGHPVYVTSIRPETNEVVVGENEDLFTRELLASDVCYMSVPGISSPSRFYAKIRYNHPAVSCTAQITSGGKLRVIFDEPVRAATPGQSVVLYDGDNVAAGGIIEASLIIGA